MSESHPQRGNSAYAPVGDQYGTVRKTDGAVFLYMDRYSLTEDRDQDARKDFDKRMADSDVEVLGNTSPWTRTTW